MKTILCIFSLLLVVFALVGCHTQAQSDAQAADMLAQEIAANKKAGLPVKGSDLQAPLPPPDQNAAPIYAQLLELLQTKPLGTTDEEDVTKVLSLRPVAAEQFATTRRILTQRKDVLALMHKAARPKCVFTRDWAKGPAVMFPEYARMRSVARWISAESALLQHDGKPLEAVRNQALGFRIANQAAVEPTLISMLVADAIDGITLRGMQRILAENGRDPTVAEAVQKAIAQNWQPHSLAFALRGEVIMQIVERELLRKQGTQALQAMLGNDKLPPSFQQAASSPESWNRFLDRGTAITLRETRKLVAVADHPYPEAQPIMSAINEEFVQKQNDPDYALGSIILPVYAQAAGRRAHDQASAEVIQTAAALLVWKAKHGAFPAKLSAAISPVPTDPYNGQPLSYRKQGRGFVLYSVGETGQFDAQTVELTQDNKEAVFRYPLPNYPAPVQ
jgi:hypothetical protein